MAKGSCLEPKIVGASFRCRIAKTFNVRTFIVALLLRLNRMSVLRWVLERVLLGPRTIVMIIRSGSIDRRMAMDGLLVLNTAESNPGLTKIQQATPGDDKLRLGRESLSASVIFNELLIHRRNDLPIASLQTEIAR